MNNFVNDFEKLISDAGELLGKYMRTDLCAKCWEETATVPVTLKVGEAEYSETRPMFCEKCAKVFSKEVEQENIIFQYKSTLKKSLKEFQNVRDYLGTLVYYLTKEQCSNKDITDNWPVNRIDVFINELKKTLEE